MNTIFGIITTTFSLAILWAIYFCIPNEHRKTTKPYFWLITFAALTLLIWSSFMTYGPRLALRSAPLPSAADKAIVVKSNDIFSSGDKWKHFDEVVKKHESRQKKDIEDKN